MNKIKRINAVLLLLAAFMTFGTLSAQDAYVDGVQAMKEGDYPGAEMHFRRALQRTPGDHSMQQMLAHAIMNQRRYREADSILYSVRQADSNHAGTYWYLGLSQVKQQHDSAALYWFKTYIRKTANQNNPNISAWLQAGSCYRRMLHTRGLNGSQLDEMLSMYRRYLKLNPTDPMVHNLTNFIDKVEELRPANPDQVWVWTER
jgi:tetratricopeptide (TPR) repeat protein